MDGQLYCLLTCEVLRNALLLLLFIKGTAPGRCRRSVRPFRPWPVCPAVHVPQAPSYNAVQVALSHTYVLCKVP